MRHLKNQVCRSPLRRFLIPKNGVALLMVIWILMLLTVIVTEFCYTMRSQTNITRNLKESTQAYYVAQAGISRAIAAVIKDRMAPANNRSEEEAALNDEKSPKWRINTEMPPIEFGKGNFTVRIRNESGRVDLNRAGPKILRAGLEGFDLDEEHRDTIVDSILDWRDANDRHRPNGAEDKYYQSLDPPYACKDADFDSVSELLLVKGVTREIFYNGLAQIATVLPAAGDKDGEDQIIEEDQDFNRINVNAAAPAVWRRLPGMTPELVEAVKKFRKEDEFRSKSQLIEVLGGEVYGKISPYIHFDSLAYFTISAVGRVAGAGSRKGIEATIVLDPETDKGYRIISWRDGIREDNAALLSAGHNESGKRSE
jgi:general secretion pathway protein K